MEYEEKVRAEVTEWKAKMAREPSYFNDLSKRFQNKVNSIIPEKVHQTITAGIKQMTRAILFGTGLSTSNTPSGINLQVREHLIMERIKFYRNTAAAEGALTGAGGILLGLADFPIWLTLKMKMLFEIASLYGADIRDYKERVYLLHIFQLTFSSDKGRNATFVLMENWTEEVRKLPDNINDFNWRNFQQEYRDYIDIAKLLQLIPGIGAVVGGYVNHRLTYKLGKVAMNAYRMRWPIAPSEKQISDNTK